MSISTPQGGGSSRQQAKKAVAGGKPNESKGSATTGSARNGGAGATKRAPGKTGGASAAGTAKSARPGARGSSTRPTAKGGGRRPITPVKVSQGRNWGPIALFSAVILVAVGIIGFAGWQVYEKGLSWEQRAARIDGVVNYRKTNEKLTEQRAHKAGPIKYDMAPPVAGDHNQNWQRCLGDVYTEAIANEHALHSMEHGAVWITYRPDLPADQVEALAKRVRGQDFLLMSPYPGQDKPISLQGWGVQLKLDNASDKRINEFIKAVKENASLEKGTPCSSGSIITETGTTPRDLAPEGGGMPAQPGS